jgi:signal transduction histidine kinase
MKKLCLILLWLLNLGKLFAQQNDIFVVKGEHIDSNLEGFLYTTKNIKVAELQNVTFKKVETSLINFGIDDDENWIKFDIENPDNQNKKMVFFLDQTFLQKADFYLFQDTILIYKNEQNQAVLNKNRAFHHPNFVFPFEVSANKRNSVYLRIKADPVYGISRAMLRLADENSFHQKARYNAFSFGVLAGFLFLSFIAGILLFYFGRKPIYAVYGVYIFSILLYYLGNSGYLNAYSAQSFIGTSRFTIGILWVGSALHLYLIHKFLDIKKHFSLPFQYFFQTLIVLSVILTFVYFWLPIPAFLSYLTRILLFIIAVLIIFLAVWGIRKKEQKTLLYSLATFPSIVLILYFLLTTLRILPLYAVSFSLAFPFTVFEIIVFGIGLVYQLNDEKQAIETKLNEERTLVASKIISAQEQERQRISQDLHDDLGSTLSMLKFQLEESNKTFDSKLFNEISITNKAVEDLRQISYNLMPTMFLQRGLLIALEEFININKIGSKVEFIHLGTEKRLDLDTELNIFRIIKELLNNAIKHAKATKIELQLIYYEAFIYVSVEDNGIGFEEKQTDMKGNGLKNINLRVNYLHGKLSLESSSKGTSILIEIPYEPDPKNKNIIN